MEILINATDSIIEDFGKSYSDSGQPMLKGRIIGLLFANDEPMALGELSKRLGVSKGPVSTYARQLEESGFIRRMWVKNDRRDYYQLSDLFFIRHSMKNKQLHYASFLMAEKYLKILSATYLKSNEADREKIKPFLQRTIDMLFFYKKVVSFYEKFIDEWPTVQKDIPLVDDYIKSLDKKGGLKDISTMNINELI